MAYTTGDIQKMFEGSQGLNEMWAEIQDFFRIVVGLAGRELQSIQDQRDHGERYEIRFPLDVGGVSHFVVMDTWYSEGRARMIRAGENELRWMLSYKGKADNQPLEVIPVLHAALPGILSVVAELLPDTKKKIEFLQYHAHKAKDFGSR